MMVHTSDMTVGLFYRGYSCASLFDHTPAMKAFVKQFDLMQYKGLVDWDHVIEDDGALHE